MSFKFASERNLRFLLHEVLDAQGLTRLEFFAEHDRESFDLMLGTALRMAEELFAPSFRAMDQEPPELVEGRVRVHPSVREIMGQAGEAGWISATFPYEDGGMQVPVLVQSACNFLFAASNFAASSYLGLTTGAANLIRTFGARELQETYIPNLIAGRWQGTMALTEPQAGSSLADVAVVAKPTDQGHYLISGQKIFISAGDHDGVENVIHLMLARIKGAPPGLKGISLFVVPRERPEAGGLMANDLSTAGLFHKMGYKGCPIVHLSMGEAGDCRGWLVGEPHKGLAYMFQMMNESRIAVGKQAIGVASGAYYGSLRYAKERPQGRPLGDKDPARPQVPIIDHADIRRLLLFQRSMVEGSLGLLLQAAKYSDLAHHGEGETKERAHLLLELLTPVVKSYPSEMGILTTSAAVQIHGGYGYTDEFTAEQYFRDMRIHPIHEGTTGIQGMDLLGRKVMIAGGAAFTAFVEEVRGAVSASQGQERLSEYAERLGQALDLLVQVTQAKRAQAAGGELDLFLADATLYLELFSLVAVAWSWLDQGRAACRGLEGATGQGERNFYNGKLHTMAYFFRYELPKIQGLAVRLRDANDVTARMPEEYFDD